MTKFHSILALSLAAALTAVGDSALAASYEVTIVNASRNQVITPPFLATHNDQVSLFQLGQPAPEFLIPLAEDGDSSAVTLVAQAAPDVFAASASAEPIMPGQSQTTTIESDSRFPLLTVAAMLASSNDAFVAVHSMMLPDSDETVSLTATVYDAGSEANTESCASIPGPPCGNGGVRDTEGAEGFVHVHSGIHGIGDLAPEEYDWRNPGPYVMVRKINRPTPKSNLD